MISYKDGLVLMKQRHIKALAEYKPKHSPFEYLKFMNDNECSFTRQHPQSENHPYYLGLFTVMSQHGYGDCAEECLDNAMESDGGYREVRVG